MYGKKALTFVSLAALACSDAGTVPDDVVVEFTSPIPSEAPAADELLVTVRVSSLGAAVPDVSVTWRVTAGEGHVVDEVGRTNQEGLASTSWVLGSGLEEGALTAEVGGTSVTARVTTVPRPPYSLTLAVETSGSVATMDSVAVVARLSDVLGNPVAAEPATWMAQIPFPGWGDWAIASIDLAGPDTVSTDADGEARRPMRFPYAADWLVSAGTATTGEVSRPLTVTSRPDLTGVLAWDTTLGSHAVETAATAASDGELVYLMPGRCRFDCLRFDSPLQVYHPAEDRWSEAAQPPDYPLGVGQGFGVAGVSAEGFHLLYPGRHHVYDPATDSWSERPPLPGGPGGSFGPGVMLEDDLFVFTPDTTWVYEVAGRSWRTTAPLPTRRSRPALVVSGADIYVAGGGESSAFERFDSRTESWTRLTDMPGGRPLSSAGAAVGDDICVFGGGIDLGRPYHHFNEVYCYDLGTGAWRAETPFPHGCTFWPTAVAVREEIYVFGGDRGEIGSGGTNVPCPRVVRLRGAG